jgi:hypothetical protein
LPLTPGRREPLDPNQMSVWFVMDSAVQVSVKPM